MIKYALTCEQGHAFESWFASSTAYDKQVKSALVSCPVCNSTKVEKAIMAPRLAGTGKRERETPAVPSPASGGGMKGEGVPPAPPTESSAPQPAAVPAQQTTAPVAMMSPQEREFRKKLRELRDHLTQNAQYVGRKFPEEARKMHYGEAEHRSIYGEASPDEAKELHEEGIDFHPLPVLPDERN
jgi:hypothetical protein